MLRSSKILFSCTSFLTKKDSSIAR